MKRAFIALGSNLDSPQEQVRQALRALGEMPRSALVGVSPRYRSKAIGPGDQPDYINAVAEVGTDLQPLELLAALQTIEQQQGRVREQRWAARTLDLDLLLYGDEHIDLPSLTVPHPRMLERNFVLRPLLDIAPDLSAPDGTRLADIAARLGEEGLSLVPGASSHRMGAARDAATETTVGDHS